MFYEIWTERDNGLAYRNEFLYCTPSPLAVLREISLISGKHSHRNPHVRIENDNPANENLLNIITIDSDYFSAHCRWAAITTVASMAFGSSHNDNLDDNDFTPGYYRRYDSPVPDYRRILRIANSYTVSDTASNLERVIREELIIMLKNVSKNGAMEESEAILPFIGRFPNSLLLAATLVGNADYVMDLWESEINSAIEAEYFPEYDKDEYEYEDEDEGED